LSLFLLVGGLACATTPGFALGTQPKPVATPKPAPRPVGSAKRPAGSVGYSHVWHTAAPGQSAPVDAHGRPMLVLQALNIPDRATLTACTEHGGFSAPDLDRAAHVLRDPRTGNEHPVEPRALDLVYRVAVHFGTPEVRIISGYRTPKPGSHSNHGRGRAIDLVFPGTSDEEVARFARELGFVGVGIYPVSGFVHLDVRERSYFWVDSSAPGKKNRERGVLADLAAKSDARATARGEHACPPFIVSSDVDAALATARTTSAAATAEDEDVDE
jgi:uncharacterized protein YcbK (DUF882 family)